MPKLVIEVESEFPGDFEYKLKETMKELGFVREPKETDKATVEGQPFYSRKDAVKIILDWYYQEDDLVYSVTKEPYYEIIAKRMNVDPGKLRKELSMLGVGIKK